MAEVTREVLIKLKIQQPNFKLKALDVSAAQAGAKQIETAYLTAYDKVQKAAAGAGGSKLQGVDVSAFTKSAGQMSAVYLTELSKIETQVDSINAKLSTMGTGVTAAANAAVVKPPAAKPPELSPAEQVLITRTAVTSNMLQAGDALKSAADGAFHMARGIMLLNVTSETELAQLVRKLAYYQGLFDVMSGGYEVVKNLVIVNRSLTAAYAVAKAAALANGTSITAMSFAMDYAKVSAIAMWTAVTGPVGLALIGVAAVTAAIGIGVYAWRNYGTAAQEAARKQEDALKKQAEAARQARYEIERLSFAIQRQRDFESQTSSAAAQSSNRRSGIGTFVPSNLQLKDSAREQYANAMAMKDIQAKMTETTVAAAQQRDRFIATAARQADLKNTDRFIGQSTGFTGSIGPESIARVSNSPQRFQALQSRLKQLAAQKPGAMTNDAAIESSVVKQLERQQALHDTIRTQIESQNASQQQRLAILGEQRQAVQKVLDIELTRYAASKQAVLDEENRRKSAVERFGELRPDQQQRLLQLGNQVKAGGVQSLNPGELQEFRNSGFGKSILSRFNYQQGTAAGADRFLQNVGELLPSNTDKLEEGQRPDESRGDFFKKQQGEIRANISKFEISMQSLVEQQKAQVESVNQGLEELADLKPVTDQIDKLIKARQEQIQRLEAKVDAAAGVANKTAESYQRGRMSQTGY